MKSKAIRGHISQITWQEPIRASKKVTDLSTLHTIDRATFKISLDVARNPTLRATQTVIEKIVRRAINHAK